MKKFWGTCENEKYFVGCNSATIYIYDKNNNELAKFKDVSYVTKAKFIPNTNILVAKSTDDYLVIYNLDELKLLKKIKVAKNIGGQDEGFAITPDAKYIYNIEHTTISYQTQITIYNTIDYNVEKILFKDNDKIFLQHIEFDENNNCYILGFMRNDRGTFDYGFISKLENDKLKNITKLERKEYNFLSVCKDWEESGYSEKLKEINILPYLYLVTDENELKRTTLKDKYNSCHN